jgi:archaellum component FlaC
MEEKGSTQEKIYNLSTIENDLNDLFARSEGLKNFIHNTMGTLKFGSAEEKQLQPKQEAPRIREGNRFKEIIFKIEDIRRILNDSDKDIQELYDLVKN